MKPVTSNVSRIALSDRSPAPAHRGQLQPFHVNEAEGSSISCEAPNRPVSLVLIGRSNIVVRPIGINPLDRDRVRYLHHSLGGLDGFAALRSRPKCPRYTPTCEATQSRKEHAHPQDKQRSHGGISDPLQIRTPTQAQLEPVPVQDIVTCQPLRLPGPLVTSEQGLTPEIDPLSVENVIPVL
jgi:hypothetical protein